MPTNPRMPSRAAERQFPVRVCIAAPPGGFGRQLGEMHAWLDAVCGVAGWAAAPAGLAGILNDAVAFYFEDAALAQAFANRFCCGYRPVKPGRGVTSAISPSDEAPQRLLPLMHKTL